MISKARVRATFWFVPAVDLAVSKIERLLFMQIGERERLLRRRVSIIFLFTSDASNVLLADRDTV